MGLVEDALEYLRMGFSVIPLIQRDKKPEINWLEYQKRKPTEDEVRKWFGSGEKNIAIICGKVSGNLVVFDFDNHESMQFVVTNIQETAQKTLVVRTGKGYHVYYRMKDPPYFKLPNLSIDVKGEGGYVVAPPSLHPSGVQYAIMGTRKVAESDLEMVNFMREMDEIYPIAKVASQWWGKEGEHRHELSLGLASFFRSRAKWPQEKTESFISGIMRLRGDNEEKDDRMRAVEDAYKKEYPYNKHLQRELVEQLVNLLPVGSGEIWRWYDKGDKDAQNWRAYMCDSTGVYRLYHKEWTDKDRNKTVDEDEETIFTQPLTLADAWHAEGDEENHVKFTFYLGKMKYQGTKTEVFQQIVASGLTGINWNFIRDSIAACVEFYISTGSVSVRQSYEAIGIYETNGRLEIALGDKDISATRGTEPWFVARSFIPYKGDISGDLKTFALLKDYFDNPALVLFFGFSALAPFSYALKKDGDFFWPLMILKGPKSTGKSALGSMFTTYMYLHGVQEGGPADVTSDFRLLDFITGTTFPRIVDESENAKFEGQKFSIKISTTLKDAAQKQIVGSRGNLDKTKKLYSARTPLILAGNKIDIEDPALLARSIIVSTGQSDKIKGARRAQYSSDILQRLHRGFGIELAKFIMEKYPTTHSILEEIRKISLPFTFSDSRRADFYSSIYIGLKIWNEFYKTFNLTFPLERYLNMDRFTDVIYKFETSNVEESKERQSIAEFIEWMKKELNVLNEYIDAKSKERDPPARYYELRYMVKEDENEGQKWLLVSQAAITEYCRVNTTFQMRSLSEVADALAEFYAADRATFYNKTTKWFEGKAAKAVKIPLSWIPLEEYGKVKDERNDGPPPPPAEILTNLTRPNQSMVRRENEDGIGVSGTPNQLTAKNIPPHEAIFVKNVSGGIDENAVSWLGISKNKDSTGSVSQPEVVRTPNHWLGNDNEFINSINQVKQFMEEYELHGRINKDDGIIIVEINPLSEVSHWINERMQSFRFYLFDGGDETKTFYKYKEAPK